MTKEIQHTLLSLLMFSMAMTSFAGEPTGVHLLFTDGSDKWFLFKTQPVVTFSDSELTITTTDASFAYTFDAVREFLFGDPDADGIKDKQFAAPRFVQTDNAVLISGASANAVGLYELSGRKLAANVQLQGDAVRVSLQSLPSGVYIIRMNNQSIKVTKK